MDLKFSIYFILYHAKTFIFVGSNVYKERFFDFQVLRENLI